MLKERKDPQQDNHLLWRWFVALLHLIPATPTAIASHQDDNGD